MNTVLESLCHRIIGSGQRAASIRRSWIVFDCSIETGYGKRSRATTASVARTGAKFAVHVNFRWAFRAVTVSDTGA